jgi:hypothetical protein
MNRRLVAIVLAIGFVCIQPLPVPTAAMEGPCEPALQFTYPATGAGPKVFNVCLSNDGNVTKLEAPGGFVHVGSAEGYLLCTAEDTYWDLGALGGSGFGAPTVRQTKGPGTLPVTITRSTTDGAWELTQAFTKDNNEQDLSVTTTLKRLSTHVAGPVYLSRYADGNMEGTRTGDFGDVSADSVWFRETRALTLTAQSLGVVRFVALGTSPLVFSDGDPTPNCRPTSAAGPIGPGDVAGIVSYDMGSFNSDQQKVARFVYQRK